jgi:hypothetical protein
MGLLSYGFRDHALSVSHGEGGVVCLEVVLGRERLLLCRHLQLRYGHIHRLVLSFHLARLPTMGSLLDWLYNLDRHPLGSGRLAFEGQGEYLVINEDSVQGDWLVNG